MDISTWHLIDIMVDKMTLYRAVLDQCQGINGRICAHCVVCLFVPDEKLEEKELVAADEQSQHDSDSRLNPVSRSLLSQQRLRA